MTSKVGAYLDDVEQACLLAPVVRSFQVRERKERLEEGFIRIRAVLTNGDILEAFEFVATTHSTLQTLLSDPLAARRWSTKAAMGQCFTPPGGSLLSASCAYWPACASRIV